MVDRKAVIDTVTGAVKRFGYSDFANGSDFDEDTETEVDLKVDAVLISGVSRNHHKVTAGAFVQMDQAEKDAADGSANVVPDKFSTAAETLLASPDPTVLSASPKICGGIPLRPDKMLVDPARSHVRVTCSLKADGAGAIIRFKEDGVEIDFWTLPDTSDVHVAKLFTTSKKLGAGLKIYEVEAELGSATSAELKYAAIALFDR